MRESLIFSPFLRYTDQAASHRLLRTGITSVLGEMPFSWHKNLLHKHSRVLGGRKMALLWKKKRALPTRNFSLLRPFLVLAWNAVCFFWGSSWSTRMVPSGSTHPEESQDSLSNNTSTPPAPCTELRWPWSVGRTGGIPPQFDTSWGFQRWSEPQLLCFLPRAQGHLTPELGKGWGAFLHGFIRPRCLQHGASTASAHPTFCTAPGWLCSRVGEDLFSLYLLPLEARRLFWNAYIPLLAMFSSAANFPELNPSSWSVLSLYQIQAIKKKELVKGLMSSLETLMALIHLPHNCQLFYTSLKQSNPWLCILLAKSTVFIGVFASAQTQLTYAV